MTSSESDLKIAIVGGGIAGLASALALTRTLQCTPQVTVFELRETPSTIGGAVNLTPNAIRYLDQIGVLAKIKSMNNGATIDEIEIFAHASGARIATLDFTNASGGTGTGFGNPPFKALRIRRADLLESLLLSVAEKSNVRVVFGKKAVGVDENTEGVTIRFEDGSTTSADLLLGCDGIHSAIRAFIEPARKPVYSAIAVINGFTTIGNKSSLLWKDTVVVSCKQGSFMASYFEPSRKKQYVAGVVEMPEVRSKEGWRAKGRDQEAVEVNLRRRFGGGAPALGVDELIESTQDWLLYPVYKLPPGGQWTRQRTLLLGDAAHAMPPQGESVGIALEDVMVFAKLASEHKSRTWPEIFAAYERLRRGRIDSAYKEANFRWDTAKDCSWLKQSLKEWLTPWFVWWSSKSRQATFEEDVGDLDLTKVFVP